MYIPIFPPAATGLMTTFPFGKRTLEPKREEFRPAIGPTFVNTRVVGLKTPIFAELRGVMMTFPAGLSTPPWNGLVPEAPTCMFEYLYVTGLKRPMFDVEYGIKTTFPFGTRTPPRKFPTERPDGTIDEKRPVAGLKNPTFDAF